MPHVLVGDPDQLFWRKRAGEEVDHLCVKARMDGGAIDAGRIEADCGCPSRKRGRAQCKEDEVACSIDDLILGRARKHLGDTLGVPGMGEELVCAWAVESDRYLNLRQAATIEDIAERRGHQEDGAHP